MESFPHGYKALVVGASGGIGSALMKQLQGDTRCSVAVGVSRSTSPALDLEDESSIVAVHKALSTQTPFHLVIDATGLLQGQGAFPEKALRYMTAESLSRAFAINTIGPALLFKHLHRLLPREGKSVFATLSARVGSIGDNQLGGWYGYRASKAALNMIMRTASIEIARRYPKAVCLALHPGTVKTSLSAPFAGNRKVFDPNHAARLLLGVIERCDSADNGRFLAYDGSKIEW